MRGTSAGYAVHIVCTMRVRRALNAKCFKLLGVRLNAPGRGGGGGRGIRKPTQLIFLSRPVVDRP